MNAIVKNKWEFYLEEVDRADVDHRDGQQIPAGVLAASFDVLEADYLSDMAVDSLLSLP